MLRTEVPGNVSMDELNTKRKYTEGEKILNKQEEFHIKLFLLIKQLVKLAVWGWPTLPRLPGLSIKGSEQYRSQSYMRKDRFG